MKTLAPFLCIAFSVSISALAQFGPEQEISNNQDGHTWARIGDVDGDGDIDVLSTSINDDTIGWYENLDGQGSFSDIHIISANAPQAFDHALSDMDGDDDPDLLVVLIGNGEIVWYENLGQGTFGTQHGIAQNNEEVYSIHVADLDGDGDNDVLAADFREYIWYENLDGLGNFGPENVITDFSDRSWAFSVHAADLDGDNDLDLACVYGGDDRVVWYENLDGQGSFGDPNILTDQANGAFSVYVDDIDGDGDLDVLSAALDDDTVAWYENLDGLGNFGPMRVITTLANIATMVRTADIDGDGDKDVLSSSDQDNKVAWYENTDGQGNFGSQQIISNTLLRARFVLAGDFDGDDDPDVLSASFHRNRLVWFENLYDGSNNDDNNDGDNNGDGDPEPDPGLIVYPVPTDGILNVSSSENIQEIRIFNLLGEFILQNTGENRIDLTGISSGIYFVDILDVKGNQEVRTILKE